MIRSLRSSVGALALVAVGVVVAAPAQASVGWIAVAGSPSREGADWAGRATQGEAEAAALQLCAQNENAADCVVVASGPLCVAIAYDGDQPLNHLYGAVGPTPAAALNAAIAAAGPAANDPTVHCTYESHS